MVLLERNMCINYHYFPFVFYLRDQCLLQLIRVARKFTDFLLFLSQLGIYSHEFAFSIEIHYFIHFFFFLLIFLATTTFWMAYALSSIILSTSSTIATAGFS